MENLFPSLGKLGETLTVAVWWAFFAIMMFWNLIKGIFWGPVFAAKEAHKTMKNWRDN